MELPSSKGYIRPENLSIMTVLELKALAKQHGCSGYSKLKKDQLIPFVKKCIEKASPPRPQAPSRIKQGSINYKSHIIQLFDEINAAFEVKTINSKALQQINDFLNVLAKTILDEAYSIVVIEDKKEITSAEIQDVIRLIFVGELANKGVSYADRIQNLQFPIDLVEPLFEKYGRVGSSASVYLTGMIEYIAKELLDTAFYFGPERIGKELSSKQIKLALEQDGEFVTLLKTLKFSFKE